MSIQLRRNLGACTYPFFSVFKDFFFENGNRFLDPVDDVRSFRVTYAFHPLHGRELPLVDRRNAWGEDRVYFHDDKSRLRPPDIASVRD